MRLSVKEQKNILNDLKHNKQKKYNKELQKLRKIIREYHFLDQYAQEVDNLKSEFVNELNQITLDDIGWERHNQMANSTESKYNHKLFELRSKILSYRDKYLIIYNYKISDNTKYIDEYLQDEQKEFEVMVNLIKNINEEEADRISHLENDLELKLKEAKVIYQKLSNSALIKEELEGRLDEFNGAQKRKALALLENRFINKKIYLEFLDEYYQSQHSLEY